MALTIDKLREMLLCATAKIKAAKDELTDIDSRFGDADHGTTMEKISKNIEATIQSNDQEKSIKNLLTKVSANVLKINGGSAVPLWNTLLTGLAMSAPDCSEISEAEIKVMFAKGLSELQELSTAKIGDKTMMDSLIPAIEAIENCSGDIKQMFKEASDAAEAGAKASENFISKFGRAKSYKEKTLGTPDAGAVSMKYFFVGLNEGLDQ